MKILIASIVILGLVAAIVGVTVGAADEASVTATVTVQQISVTVSNGIVLYGTLATGASEDTTSNGVNNSQIATNNGNVAEKLSIKGQNSSPAGWVLATSAADNQYAHKFCTTNCDTAPTWKALTTDYQTLIDSVAKDGTETFDLQILTPSSASSYEQQTVNVVVLAEAF